MAEKRPLIGVCPTYNNVKARYVLPAAYMEALESAGAAPLILPFATRAETLSPLLARCGGFLLTGGHDVDPALYGSKKSPLCGPLLPQRDQLDQLVIQAALQHGKALLGLCRGAQMLHVALGGALYQHLPEALGMTVRHQGETSETPVFHPVRLLPGGPLADLLGRTDLLVNSLHHQGILGPPAGGLQGMAEAPDGLTEAFFLPGRPFVWGLQWHPELDYRESPYSRAVFSAFVRAAQ